MAAISFATATDSLLLLRLSVLSAAVVAYGANTSARLVPPLLSCLPGALGPTPIALTVVEIHQSKLRWIGRRPIADFSSHHLSRAIPERLHLLMNFGMDSDRNLCLLPVGPTLLRQTLTLLVHESLRQRFDVSHVSLQIIRH